MRKATKAKEVAKLVASKQCLKKDPAALAAANLMFTDCDDMRTRIQTKLAYFIQDSLKDYQNKAANLNTAATFLTHVFASGITGGTPGLPGTAGVRKATEGAPR